MEQVTINAQLRAESGTSAARKFRREGLIPAVVYARDKAPSNIVIPARDFALTLRRHAGTQIFDLEIEGQETDADLAALLKEVQRHPLSRQIISVDLQWVSLKEAVQVNVAIVLVGESPGVVEEGGALDQILFEIPVSCLPREIPDFIELDISNLTMEHALYISDIVAPEGVEILLDPSDAVATVGRGITAEDLETRVEGEELLEDAELEGEEEGEEGEEAEGESAEGEAAEESAEESK